MSRENEQDLHDYHDLEQDLQDLQDLARLGAEDCSSGSPDPERARARPPHLP